MRIGLRKKSLLLVEDNFVVQESIKEIAEEVGFCVICASNRKSATELIKCRFFDVAVFDKRLVEADENNSDGFAVLKYMISLKENTYTILLTSYGTYSEAVELQDYVNRFIEKKSSPLELAHLLYTELTNAINVINEMHVPKKLDRSESLFFCDNNPVAPIDKALRILNPRDGSSTLTSLIKTLIETIMPVQPLLNDDNIIFCQEKKNIKGLFWSRGIGQAVIVVISKTADLNPEDIDIADGWPDGLIIRDVMYTKNEKNLYASIVSCSGVCLKDFYS